MKRNIIINLKRLKMRSKEVLNNSKEDKEYIKVIIHDLEDSLDIKKGIGLSAIQIGISEKIGIIRIEELRLDLINTKIIDKQNKFRMKKEGCLSFPNLYIDTIRYNIITIINNKKEETYNGIIAVAIQHEVDHFNGITIFDRKWKKI